MAHSNHSNSYQKSIHTNYPIRRRRSNNRMRQFGLTWYWPFGKRTEMECGNLVDVGSLVRTEVVSILLGPASRQPTRRTRSRAHWQYSAMFDSSPLKQRNPAVRRELERSGQLTSSCTTARCASSAARAESTAWGRRGEWPSLGVSSPATAVDKLNHKFCDKNLVVRKARNAPNSMQFEAPFAHSLRIMMEE